MTDEPIEPGGGDPCQPARLELVAVLGHELRTPLAALRSALHALEMGAADAELRDRMLAVLRRQVIHLSALVDNLLDASTRSAADLAMRREELDLAALVRGLVDSQLPTFASSGLTLRSELPSRPVPVTGDAVRLGQVVDNLLANALKFTPAGGEVRVALEDGGGGVRLIVADTGDGIDGADHDRLFEPFQRGAAGRRRASGLGLGLAIVRRLVEAHGGTVEVHSDGHGHGSEFLVRLPSAQRPAQQPPTGP